METAGKGQRNPATGKAPRKTSNGTVGKTPRNTGAAVGPCCCGCEGDPCTSCGGSTPNAITLALADIVNLSGMFPCAVDYGGGTLTDFEVTGSWDGGTFCLTQDPVTPCRFFYAAAFSDLVVIANDAGGEVCRTDSILIQINFFDSPDQCIITVHLIQNAVCTGAGWTPFSPDVGALVFYADLANVTLCTAGVNGSNDIAVGDATGCQSGSPFNAAVVSYDGTYDAVPCC